MLPRSLNELYDNLRDFWVAQENDKVVGCCSLHVSWEDLTEIKSLAVTGEKQKKGTGANLVMACLDEAKELGAKKVFVLTYKPAYFRKFGFRTMKYSQLPHKVWAECINCPKFPNCQEIPMMKRI